MTALAPLLLMLPTLAGEARVFPTGQVVERVACRADASQTYALYLPGRYDSTRRWPTLLVLDPGGRAVPALELFREAAERYGWIVLSSYDIRSGGPAEGNVKALDAMWPEAHRRFATDPRRIYAAGFSGGAHLAWALGKTPGALAGVIASGGRFIPELLPEAPSYASFVAAGDTDFNYQGTRRMDEALGQRGAPHRIEIFTGPHQWMPTALARLAVQWMELQAMRQGLAPRDEKLIAEAFAAEVEAARALELAPRPLEALRRLDAVARSFAALSDTGGVEREAACLGSLPAVAAELEAEKRWDGFEERYDRELGRAIGLFLGAEEPMTSRRLLAELEVDPLLRQATTSGVAATTARRLLNRIYTQTAYTLPQELLANGRIPLAIASLETATAIRPADPVTWYNLACARSRGGMTRAAIEALGSAVDHGFKDAALLASDPDLAAIRKLEGFQGLQARLKP